MKITICELPDEHALFEQSWQRLVEHSRDVYSDLVVLNEMPFASWFCASPTFNADVWQAAVDAHDRWLTRLSDLAPATVIASRPVSRAPHRVNEGFLWSTDQGYQGLHHKVYLPEEEGTWEASWYQPGSSFDIASTDFGKFGFLICSELWAMKYAQQYGKAGAQLIVVPRATGRASVEKWLVGGRAAAVVSGAFVASSNRVGPDFGGWGWLVGPDGDVLATTSPAQPFVTVEIDLQEADRAKSTYPRYILD
jgi:N-carbamoylputrescine amidase